MNWAEVKPQYAFYEELVWLLCRHAYPNHPRGCPNFSKKKGCPPGAPLIFDVLDLDAPVYAIWNIFDLAAHVQRMKERHPQWTERQLYCCLYWQPKARKQLEQHIANFRSINGQDLFVLRNPEASGVNVIKMMAGVGHVLEWPPRIKAYQVAIAGTRRNELADTTG